MNVAVDIGNTNTKLGFFENGQLISLLDKLDPEAVPVIINQKNPEAAIISSVSADAQTLAAQLNTNKVLILDASTELPFSNGYHTPQTLGADRLAIAAASRQLYPNSSVLSIALGTCITYNLIDKEGKFWGGAISPGLEMRAKAMHTFTARLPLVEVVSSEISPWGSSTIENMQAGVFHGVLFEIEGFIRQFQLQHQDLQIIICGGASILFEKKIKASIFAIPELVLVGLHAILTYNVNKKEK